MISARSAARGTSPNAALRQRWRRVPDWARLLAVGAAISVGNVTPAQNLEPEAASPGPGPATSTDTLSRLPRGAFIVPPAVGVPVRKLFRDTGAPYTDSLRAVSFEPTVRTASAEASIHLDLPTVHGRFPLLDRGFEPDDADLKVGPLYFDLRALSAAVLWSDNVNRSEDDREADTIGILRLSGAVVAQLTEGFRISAAGSFVYLPFEGKAGISGFGLFAPYSIGLNAYPGLESQVTWDTIIGGWPVVFADDFRVGVARFSIGTRDDFEIFEGGQFDEADTAGRYTFRATPPRQDGDRVTRDETDVNIIYFSNVVSASTERLLPGPIRLRVRAYHENLWYPDDDDGLPRQRDAISMIARSERENTRFKPFIAYSATRREGSGGITHLARTGVDGPITDQLRLHLDAGWFHRDANGASRYLWRLGLHHIAGPYTEHSLTAGRTVSDFRDELSDHIRYQIRQVLGPKLIGEANVSLARVEDLEGDSSDREIFRTGLRLTFFAGPKTTLRAIGSYSHLESAEDDFGDRETWTGRLELTYRFTGDLLARAIYQYQKRDSDRPDNSYDENLLFFSLTKYFR